MPPFMNLLEIPELVFGFLSWVPFQDSMSSGLLSFSFKPHVAVSSCLALPILANVYLTANKLLFQEAPAIGVNTC